MASTTFVGPESQWAEARRRLALGESFTAAELAGHLGLGGPSRANDIIADLLRNGEVIAEGRPRRVSAA
jgi:hypothetical protein